MGVFTGRLGLCIDSLSKRRTFDDLGDDLKLIGLSRDKFVEKLVSQGFGKLIRYLLGFCSETKGFHSLVNAEIYSSPNLIIIFISIRAFRELVLVNYAHQSRDLKFVHDIP